VVVSTNGLLNGWLDLQANGNWTDPGDRVFTNVSVSAGTNLLTMAVPASASASNTFARFRFSMRLLRRLSAKLSTAKSRIMQSRFAGPVIWRSVPIRCQALWLSALI
jgi:hypothetical protein